jgi:hypothetical protein
LPGTAVVAECPAVSYDYRVTVCLCTSCSFEMCIGSGFGLLAGGVVTLVLCFVLSCYQRGLVFPRLVLLCCIGGFVPLILICNYHKHGISCVWYWTYVVSVLAVLLLTVSCSGGCWSVCGGGWPSVLV